MQENVAHLHQYKFAVLEGEHRLSVSSTDDKQIGVNNYAVLQSGSSMRTCFTEQNGTSTGIIYPLEDISNFWELYLFHKYSRKKVAGKQSSGTVVYSLNKAFSPSRQPLYSFLYFYNESTSICSILVRCRNYVPDGNRKTSRVWSWGLIYPWAREAAAQRHGCWTAWQRQSIQGALQRDRGHFLCIWSREISVVLSGTSRMLIWANELCGAWLPSGWQRTASG